MLIDNALKLNLGDTVVLWRTWWLYRRDFFLITLLPIITWLGGFGERPSLNGFPAKSTLTFIVLTLPR